MSDPIIGLFRPVGHGALGPLDELANLVPLVIGCFLLIYLYRDSYKRRAREAKQEKKEQDQPQEK